MAAQQTPYRQAAAVQQAMTVYRRLRITRAAWIETAVVTQPGAEQEAVSAN